MYLWMNGIVICDLLLLTNSLFRHSIAVLHACIQGTGRTDSSNGCKIWQENLFVSISWQGTCSCCFFRNMKVCIFHPRLLFRYGCWYFSRYFSMSASSFPTCSLDNWYQQISVVWAACFVDCGLILTHTQTHTASAYKCRYWWGVVYICLRCSLYVKLKFKR